MKYLTFAVPCYNSEDYMRHCVDTLLSGGEDVEIVIVNDGSKDGTLAIANEYAARYPGIVRVVDKENGGHGSGVNAGLKLASGLYYKVVDSDDWVDEKALAYLLNEIKKQVAESASPDLYIINFVYEHVKDNTCHVNSYTKMFPVGMCIGWNEVKKFHFSHMLLMHSLVYRTETLRNSGLVLPEHTFYVDDIYSYDPLPYVKSICYFNVDLYRYFIGRADQSVNFVNMAKRYEQMIRVMETMTDAWTYRQIMEQPRGLRRYMFHALANYMMTTFLFVCAENSGERKAAYKGMWAHIKGKDKELYRKLRYGSYVFAASVLPWRLRRVVLVISYKILCKRIKLG